MARLFDMKPNLLPVAFVVGVATFGLCGCSTRASSSPPGSPSHGSNEAPVLPLPALTVDEERAMQTLEKHIAYLGSKVGERNESKHWELADAADYIAGELEGMGFALERQGYETKNVAAQNLAVTIAGAERGDQIFVVGAHYDSPAGDPGKNAGGSGTAALLTLAEMMHGARLKRTLRFVFFSMGEAPHGNGEGRGARHYARYLSKTEGRETNARGEGSVTKRAETVGLLHLDRLGSFEPTPESRAPLSARLVVTPGSEVLRRLFLEDVDSEILSVVESTIPEEAESDLLAFHEAGIPGVSLRGTGRDERPVDREQLARVVMQIRRGIGRISGERPTNDGMLTPLSEQIR